MAAKKKDDETALFKECSSLITPFDDALSDLNSKLGVGMQFADYGSEVGQVNAVHTRLLSKAKAQGGVSDECVDGVATPLENALRAYVTAYDTWNKCTADYNCSFDDGSDALKSAQASWAKASRLIAKGEDGLASLQPS